MERNTNMTTTETKASFAEQAKEAIKNLLPGKAQPKSALERALAKFASAKDGERVVLEEDESTALDEYQEKQLAHAAGNVEAAMQA